MFKARELLIPGQNNDATSSPSPLLAASPQKPFNGRTEVNDVLATKRIDFIQ